MAVLFGGDSSEREISLLSGNAVLEGLKRRGVDAHAFDPRDQSLAQLLAQRFERVWIALHGPGGEDGTLQGALEYLGIPYTGSGVMGSAIGMDKLRTKRLALSAGVPTADFAVLRGPEDFASALERLGLPLIVKPATQGSSVGMSKVERAADLPAAFDAAAQLETLVFAEPWIPGKEYTVSILQDQALPAIRIETPKTFYDYEAKYSATTRATSVPRGCLPVPRRTWQALGTGRLCRCRGLRLGPRGFHAGCAGEAPAAGDQHHPGHDQPQPGADGRARHRRRLRRTGVART